MVHQVVDDLEGVEKKSLPQKLREFISPISKGKFGLAIDIGKTELFIGVQLSSIVTEVAIRRRKSSRSKASGPIRRAVDF